MNFKWLLIVVLVGFLAQPVLALQTNYSLIIPNDGIGTPIYANLATTSFPIIADVTTTNFTVTGTANFTGANVVGLTVSGSLTINGAVSTTFHFTTSSDTNIGVSITTSTNGIIFNPYWTGTLADSRIASAATWNAKLNPAYPSLATSSFLYIGFQTLASSTYLNQSYPAIATSSFLYIGFQALASSTYLGVGYPAIATSTFLALAGGTLTGGLVFTTASGTSATSTNFAVNMLHGNGILPTVSTSTGAGTGVAAVATIDANSTNLGGRIHLNTGTAPVANGTAVTLTFNKAFPSAPFCILGNASSTPVNFFATTTASTLVLKAGGTALNATTWYEWYYHCTY